jgi:hypothetical protein
VLKTNSVYLKTEKNFRIDSHIPNRTQNLAEYVVYMKCVVSVLSKRVLSNYMIIECMYNRISKIKLMIINII